MRKKKYNKYIIGKEYSIMFVNYKNIVLSVLIDNEDIEKVWVANISKDKKKITKQFKTKEEAISWRKNQELLLYGKGA